MTPFRIVTEGQILVRPDGDVEVHAFATEGGSGSDLLEVVADRVAKAAAKLLAEKDDDAPASAPDPLRWQELRERLAVALCQGHLDIPADQAQNPEGVGEYLAAVAGRLAFLLTAE